MDGGDRGVGVALVNVLALLASEEEEGKKGERRKRTIMAQETMPLLTTCDGLLPNQAGSHSTRSASLPGSRLPTMCDMPWAMAGLMVYLLT